MPSSITIKNALAADVPTPAVDKITIFLDDSTGEPAFKKSDGSVNSFTGLGLPAGGTVGQYLRKLSSTDGDAAFATIAESEITNLVTDLAALDARLDILESVNPDVPPVSPNAMDDEFTSGSSINLSLWSPRFGAVTGLTNSVSNGRLILTLPQTAATIMQGYYQNMPAGDCAFVIKRFFGQGYFNYHNADIFLERSTGASRKTLIWAVGWNGGPNQNIARHSTDSDTFASPGATASGISYSEIHTPLWYRVRYSGTNVIFEQSYNGISWNTLLTEAEATHLGGRVDRIGIGMTNGDASHGDAVGYFDYFRRTA